MGGRAPDGLQGRREIRLLALSEGLRQRIRPSVLDRLGMPPDDLLSRAIHDHEVSVLSGNWAVFAAPRLHPNVWYCHTPVRVFYDLRDSFLGGLPRVRRWAARRWIEKRRPEYEAAVAAVQTIVANSRNVERRIDRYLHRTADVVYPPLDSSRYRFKEVGEAWLAVSRL